MQRQYIGARYVPKFFDNEGSSEWARNVVYEPLTIVTYLGNVYTSKIPVPSNIGEPNLNPKYWANTGIYGGAIDEIREQINQIESELTELNTTLNNEITVVDDLSFEVNIANSNKLLLFGDSYLQGYTPNGTVINWGNILKGFLKINDDDYYSYPNAGCGFANDGFKTSINNAIQNMDATTKKLIKNIVIAGSYNDWNYESDVILSKINECRNLITTNFPNANLYIIPIGWACQQLVTDPVHANVEYWKLRRAIRSWYVGCTGSVITCPYSYTVLMDNRCFSSDYVHPNETGQYLIARMIYTTLKGTKDNYYPTFIRQELQNVTGYNGVLDAFTVTHTVNGETEQFVFKSEARYIPTNPMNLTCSPGVTVTIGNYKDAGVPAYDGIIYFSCDCYVVTTDNKYYNIFGGVIQLSNGNINYIPRSTINANNNNYLTINNIKEFDFRPRSCITVSSLEQ